MRLSVAAFHFLICFCFGLMPVMSFAQPVEPSKIERLMQQPDRPTMSEFLNAFGVQLPDQNPFRGSQNISDRTWNEGPRIIAVLEYAFPGGTYASIGRDAVHITDLLEAFYLSIGQTGRTQRIELSGTSLPLAADFLLPYLEQKGLNLNPQQAVDHPFVIFDRTLFEYTSQSTEIYDIVRSAFINQGGNPAEFLKRFNMATTFFNQKDQATDIDQQLQKQKEKGSFLSSNHNFIGINTKYTDLTPWHQSFRSLKRRGDKIVASPGPLASTEQRQQVLHDLFEIAKVAQSPRFAAQVDHYAKTHGMGDRFYSRLQAQSGHRQQLQKAASCRGIFH